MQANANEHIPSTQRRRRTAIVEYICELNPFSKYTRASTTQSSNPLSLDIYEAKNAIHITKVSSVATLFLLLKPAHISYRQQATVARRQFSRLCAIVNLKLLPGQSRCRDLYDRDDTSCKDPLQHHHLVNVFLTWELRRGSWYKAAYETGVPDDRACITHLGKSRI